MSVGWNLSQKLKAVSIYGTTFTEWKVFLQVHFHFASLTFPLIANSSRVQISYRKKNTHACTANETHKWGREKTGFHPAASKRSTLWWWAKTELENLVRVYFILWCLKFWLKYKDFGNRLSCTVIQSCVSRYRQNLLAHISPKANGLV